VVRLCVACAALVLVAPTTAPGAAQVPVGDGPQQLLSRLQRTLEQADSATFRTLFDAQIPESDVAEHWQEMMRPGTSRYVVRERDRTALMDAAPGDGYRLALEVFAESESSARVVTSGIDVRKLPDGDASNWTIVRAEGLSTVQGLYRLRLAQNTQYAARDLTITAPDLQVTIRTGTVFMVGSPEGITGAVLLGDGEMRFTPTPTAERGQLRLYSGAEALVTRFDSAFLRFNPADYSRTIPAGALREGPVDQRTLRRAQDVVEREMSKSYVVDFRDVSEHTWHVIPRPDDFLAEVRTGNHGTLTYTRAGVQVEDVSLIRRDRRLTIALYPSEQSLARNGRFYSDDAQREYDVLDYDIEASVTPSRRFLRSRARLQLRARLPLTTLTLKLADGLAVSGVSSENGPLGFVRLRNQNAVFVRLARVLPADGSLTLTVNYSGPIESQSLETGGLQAVAVEGAFPIAETHLLQSSASFWYPQNPLTDYATATIRVFLPEGFSCVASGERIRSGTHVLSSSDPQAAAQPEPSVFRASQPVRYLALLVGRFVPVDAHSLQLPGNAEEGIAAGEISVNVTSHPLARSRARDLVGAMDDILRFYSELLGSAPYPSAQLTLVEADLPGGHSPPYFVLLNSPITTTNVTWRNDPAAFQGFPEFFLAHELAHQWWGQAVGWKNYREQWISEGFAQYFAALYAQRSRGDRIFTDMLRQFRSWSLDESDKGPVHLGQRLGQISGGQRVFRALVYNKGAAVLHMLRRVVGDDAFFRGLRRFYRTHLFQPAGTGDLQLAMETESGQKLDRFFEQWILGSSVPRVNVQSNIQSDAVTVRLTQEGAAVFDLPVTITLVHADGSMTDEVIVMRDTSLEHRITPDRPVRQVRVNRDSAAVAEFRE
jgi:hypothetical protein